ncbi:carboxymuconolactone decarboxylase family protein [Chryseobacterium sp. A321]
MSHRIQLATADPAALQAMLGLEKYLSQSGLDKNLFELIKIRASQLNGCAYCLNMHTRDALKIGETPQRIFLLDAWRETKLYTPKERAVLALTEKVTLISKGPISDEAYAEAKAHLSDQQLAAVLMAIVTINGWNRLGITLENELD